MKKTFLKSRLKFSQISCFLFLLSYFSFAASPAFALQHLEGQKAREYLGDLKTRLTQGGYTYEILKRSHRDSMNGRFSDGVIASRVSNRFYYKGRRDSHHTVIIGDPQGREEDPITADALVWKPLENTLHDDHPNAHVYLDDQGNELALVFIGHKTYLGAKMNDQNLLEITIEVLSAAPKFI